MAERLDPSLFGGTGIPEELTAGLGRSAAPVIQPQAQAVTSELFPAQRAERTALEAHANRTRVSGWESFKAGLAQTDAAAILSNWGTPDDVPDPEWNSNASFNMLEFTPTAIEHDYLKQAQSQDGWESRLQRIQKMREYQQDAADNPGLAIAGTFLDPLYMAGPLVLGKAASAMRAGRTLAAGAGAAVGAAVGAEAAEGAVRDPLHSILLGAITFGAGTALTYRSAPVPDAPGVLPQPKPKYTRVQGEWVQADPDFPAEAMQQVIRNGKPKVRRAADGSWERVPPGEGGELVSTPEQAEALMEHQAKTWAQRTGERLQLSMHKTMASSGPVGRKIADLLFDNNGDLAKNSVESHQRAIRTGFTTHQRVLEDEYRALMAERGAGLWQRTTSPRRSAEIQRGIDDEVYLEMMRRQQLANEGKPITFEGVDPKIKSLADKADATTAPAALELRASGVLGAEELAPRPGWLTRRYSVTGIEGMQAKVMATGLSAEQAGAAVKSLLATSLRRANGFSQELAQDIANAVVNRTIRKGYHEDAVLLQHQGSGNVALIRHIIEEEGLSPARLRRVLDVLEGKTAEAGKPGFLKHRLELDYKATAFVNGAEIRVLDMLDTRLLTHMDQYLDGAAAQAAWARAGVKNINDLTKLRSELSHSIKDPQERARQVQLFDNATAFLSGHAAGEPVHPNMRLLMSWNRSTSLGNSGLWQSTEFANISAQYGLIATTKQAIKEMPLFRKLWQEVGTDVRTSTMLRDVLTRHSQNDIRLRPYIQRFEDNFEIPDSSALQLAAQQVDQMVPIANGMKFVHAWQARTTANLITNRLAQAAEGNVQLRNMLQKYGIEAGVMEKLSLEVQRHGMDTAKWSDAVWAQVRPAFAKMMDEAVLHSRLGDMPAFMKFDKVGKFLGTYRTFTLTAHNKLMSGKLQREGSSGLALLLLHQLPLAMLAVRAQEVAQGRKPSDMDGLAFRAMGIMGGFGMFSELVNIASGNTRAFGSPGTIVLDRLYGLTGEATSGDAAGAASAAAALVPILGFTPIIKQLQNRDE